VVSEEIGAQPDIVPMQVRAIKHIRKVYGCRAAKPRWWLPTYRRN
jgi:hypothetical protein